MLGKSLVNAYRRSMELNRGIFQVRLGWRVLWDMKNLGEDAYVWKKKKFYFVYHINRNNFVLTYAHLAFF